MSTRFYSNIYGRLNYNNANRVIPIANKCYNANSPDAFDVGQIHYSYRSWYEQQMGLNENNMYQDAYTTQLDTPIPTNTDYMAYEAMPHQYTNFPPFYIPYSRRREQSFYEPSTYGMSAKMRMGTILMNSKRVPKVTTFY